MEVLVNTSQDQRVPPISDLDIVRAWKDARYRRSLSAQQLEILPYNPAGPAMLTDAELKTASGLALQDDDAEVNQQLTTALTCTETTFHMWKNCGC